MSESGLYQGPPRDLVSRPCGRYHTVQGKRQFEKGHETDSFDQPRKKHNESTHFKIASLVKSVRRAENCHFPFEEIVLLGEFYPKPFDGLFLQTFIFKRKGTNRTACRLLRHDYGKTSLRLHSGPQNIMKEQFVSTSRQTRSLTLDGTTRHGHDKQWKSHSFRCQLITI